MASKDCRKRQDTLCWECANSVNGDKCPWVKDFTPVNGWDAEPDLIWYNTPLVDGVVKHEQPSYIVKNCPLFEYGPDDKITLTNSDVVQELASAIILRGHKDFNVMKKRGNPSDLKETTGEVVYLEDIIKFFRSKWMDILTNGVTSDRSAEDIRREMGIKEGRDDSHTR